MTEPDKEQGQSTPVPVVSSDNSDYNAVSESSEKPTLFQSKPTHHQHRGSAAESSSCEPSNVVSPTPTRLQRLLFKMYLVLKEVTVMLFLAFTYAALTNDSSKISKSPTALPFFPKNSMVADWYNGELSTAVESSRKSDIAFVMYYAPWDAESQEVRREFELTARYLHRQVTFAAVNCWQPGSECRKQYAKSYNWPILIVYPPHGSGIQYKGPRLARYMCKFLLAFSMPLIRIEKEDEINSLMGNYDAVVVGCVNAATSSSEYGAFYRTSLRFLEKDPFRDVGFAVLTGNYCGEDSTPRLTVHMWNETLIYPSDLPWKSDALFIWIFDNLHRTASWATPVVSKSILLSNYIQRGPALILFTPRNMLIPSVDYYDLLKEVALEYHNCKGDQHISYNLQLLRKKRLENYLKRNNKIERSCNSIMKENEYSDKCPSTVTVTSDWLNGSRCSDSSYTTKNSKCFTLLHARDKNIPSASVVKHSSKWIHRTWPDEPIVDQQFRTSMLSNRPDHKSAKILLKRWKRDNCRLAFLAERVAPIVWVRSMNKDETKPDVTGVACRTNTSLTLVAIDSLRYHQFAERLGVTVSDAEGLTAAVIVDEKAEAHHVLRGQIDEITLREFVLNYTVGVLTRSFDSLVTVDHPETHAYLFKNGRSKTRNDGIYLLELNSKTFLKTILQEDKAVVVFYYSKQCSFCNGISYAFLTVAKMFSSLESLQFRRIDGDLNILPWEYTMDSYPTILLFPAKSKSESRAFPKTVPASVPNLISFLLANLDSTLKLHAMWSICNQTKFKTDKESCISSVRTENLSLIDQTLRLWRKADVLARIKLFHRLQNLRNINLLLAHSPKNAAEIHRHMRKLHVSYFSNSSGVSTHRKKIATDGVKDEL